jgi:hypothetical protein
VKMAGEKVERITVVLSRRRHVDTCCFLIQADRRNNAFQPVFEHRVDYQRRRRDSSRRSCVKKTGEEVERIMVVSGRRGYLDIR